jgi:hypothetical protein
MQANATGRNVITSRFAINAAWRSPTARDAESGRKIGEGGRGAAHTAPAILCVDWKKSGQVITPGQIRAARLLLVWKQTDLAAASGLSETEIRGLPRCCSW